MKHTKIIATLGPASDSIKTITAMVKAGMRVARLNFSHGTYAHHAKLIRNVRAVSKKLRTPVAIMQDLQGPKIRVKQLKRPVEAKTGRYVVIGRDFDIDFDVRRSIKPGHNVFIQDGLIQLKVRKINKAGIHCLVVNGGKIQSHKGVNLPRTKLALPSLTAKDLEDLHWGLIHGVDLVAISFVRTVNDLMLLKNEIRKAKTKTAPGIVAKIEKPEAVKNIASIIKGADVIMIARGDLGVEVPEEQVPIIQNFIVKKCRRARKPVIVATQMLESMVNNPRPTRAEVEDVADAVVEGADYTMLSEETAFGKYPVEAVKEMHKILLAEEKANQKK